MPFLMPFRLIALFAYFATFSNYIEDEIVADRAITDAFGSFYYDLAVYEYALMQDPANAPVEKVASKINPEVTLPSGTIVKGKEYAKSRTFHNIPYAEAPVGQLR